MSPGQQNTRHGNRFRDAAARNPLRAPPPSQEPRETGPLTAREELALLVWNGAR